MKVAKIKTAKLLDQLKSVKLFTSLCLGYIKVHGHIGQLLGTLVKLHFSLVAALYKSLSWLVLGLSYTQHKLRANKDLQWPATERNCNFPNRLFCIFRLTACITNFQEEATLMNRHYD